jgi:hypothetical protein
VKSSAALTFMVLGTLAGGFGHSASAQNAVGGPKKPIALGGAVKQTSPVLPVNKSGSVVVSTPRVAPVSKGSSVAVSSPPVAPVNKGGPVVASSPPNGSNAKCTTGPCAGKKGHP